MARPLEGRVFVITGASSGIGRATALEAARAGMDLALVARRADRLADVAAQVRSSGRRALEIVCDVAKPGASARILDEVEREFRRFDAVFANAGYGAEVPIVELSESELRRMFDVNFFAATELLRESARRLLREGRGGHLLMCSSCLSRFSLPRYGAYAATKAAQAMVCQAMRYELAGSRIDVTSVHPVTTSTEFFEIAAGANGTDAHNSHAPKWVVQPPERVAAAVVRTLRHPRPEVWTSFPARFAASIFTLFPRVGDWSLRHRGGRGPTVEAPPARAQ